MKKTPALLIVSALFSLLSACTPSGSRQAELNRHSGQFLLVSALAIDLHGDGYTMTVESIRQDRLEGDASPAYFSVHADSFDALFEQADAMLSSRLYLMHTRTIIISDAIAHGALTALTDSLLSRPDARLTVRIAVAREHTPAQLLRAEAISESIPGIALASMLDQRVSDGLVADLPLFRMLDRQMSGLAFSLPVLRLSPDGHTAPDGSIDISAVQTEGGEPYA